MIKVDTCPICREIFNFNLNYPKLLPCCNQIYCLACIIKQFNNNNNYKCSFCRAEIKKNPNDLKTTELPLVFKCKNCPHQTRSKELVTDPGELEPKIKCDMCSPGGKNLMKHLNEMVKDMQDIKFTVFIPCKTKEKFKEIIEKYVSEHVDFYLNKLIQDLKTNLTERLLNKVENALEINSSVFNYFEKFSNMHEYLKNLQQVTPDRMNLIEEYLSLYSKDFENVLFKGSAILNLDNMAKDKTIVSIDKQINHFFGNEILNCFTLNIGDKDKGRNQINISNSYNDNIDIYKENMDLKIRINELYKELSFYKQDTSASDNSINRNYDDKDKVIFSSYMNSNDERDSIYRSSDNSISDSMNYERNKKKPSNNSKLYEQRR